MIEIKNVDKNYNAKEIFQNLSLSIPLWTIAWLIGKNGSGKTTFLKLLLWEEKPENGEIIFTQKSLKIWYMKQEIPIENREDIVFDFIKKELGIFEIEKELRDLEKNLENEENFTKYSNLYELFEAKWWYAIEYEFQNILSGFDLQIDIYSRKISELSSGQKSKILLSLALLEGKDLLLLDEPTNNLDQISIDFLTQYIKKSQASFLIISHNRDFLDQICNKIYEFDDKNHTIEVYEGNYSFFENKKEEKHQKELVEYEINKQKIQDLKSAKQEAQDRVQRTKNAKRRDNDKFQAYFFLEAVTKWYGSKVNQFSQKIDDLSTLEKPQNAKKIHYVLQETSVFWYIRFQDVSYQYKNTWFSLNIPRFQAEKWDRIGIFGNNGSGKTTFLSLLNWDIEPDSWERIVSQNISIGSFSQEHNSLPREKSSLELLIERGNISEMEAHKLLGIFHLDIEERHKKIKLLSPGQRAKLIFTLFQLQNYNTLILDEPTNHLDMEAIWVIENALQDFDGILIVVSHDKKFMENLNLKVLYDVEDWVLRERVGS